MLGKMYEAKNIWFVLTQSIGVGCSVGDQIHPCCHSGTSWSSRNKNREPQESSPSSRDMTLASHRAVPLSKTRNTPPINVQSPANSLPQSNSFGAAFGANLSTSNVLPLI